MKPRKIDIGGEAGERSAVNAQPEATAKRIEAETQDA
jgi:hypothetical protein